MVSLTERVNLMVRLGEFLNSGDQELYNAIEYAHQQNGWFDHDSVSMAIKNIADQFLDKKKLEQWVEQYPFIGKATATNSTVGLVMAGNIPLVGFHDFLCAFISGYNLKIKLSSKDSVLWKFIFNKLTEWQSDFENYVCVSELLKDCDAYIATGSNNSARYFEYYFKKYPHIIRRNRTSVAVLTGSESDEQLQFLTNDICSYYGLGCRNVTQIFVPENYDFEPLLTVLKSWDYQLDNHKYKNNYDYQLALMLLNKVSYLTNGNMLLTENTEPFAAISCLHYQYYRDKQIIVQQLLNDDRYQCIVGEGNGLISFGNTQVPQLDNYADGIDTMQFLSSIKKN